MARKKIEKSTEIAVMPDDGKLVNWPASRVEMRPLVELIPYLKNARLHTEDEVEQVKRSMDRWGWTIPVLVDEAGVIIAGHRRVRAGYAMGYELAPCVVARGWDEPMKAAYRIADNKLAENAEWDTGLLAEEFEALAAADFDLTLTGFSDEEIADLVYEDGPPGEDFKEFDEQIETEHECPKCGFQWSGSSATSRGQAAVSGHDDGGDSE